MRRLTTEWSVDLDESYMTRVVDGDLQMVSPGPPVRTVWITVWSPPEELSIDQIKERVRQDAHPSPVQRFDEKVDDSESRLGSWYSETVGDRSQWGLYGYTVRRGTYVQAAFLSDEVEGLEWALRTWRSLRYTPTP